MTRRSQRYGKLVRGWDWRTTPERLQKGEQVADNLGMTKTELIETALDNFMENEMDRMEQLKQLDIIADSISYYYTDGMTAEDLVAYTEKQDGLPKWLDNVDRRILIEKVQNLIS